MRVTRRGQVTIPKEIRDRTGIDDGTEVEFFEENGRIVLVKAATKNPFLGWVGHLDKPSSSDEAVQRMRGHQ